MTESRNLSGLSERTKRRKKKDDNKDGSRLKKVRRRDITQNPFYKRLKELERLENALKGLTKEIKGVYKFLESASKATDEYYSDEQEILKELREEYATVKMEYEKRVTAFNEDLIGKSPNKTEEPKEDEDGLVKTEEEDDDSEPMGEDSAGEALYPGFYEHFPDDDEEFDEFE